MKAKRKINSPQTAPALRMRAATETHPTEAQIQKAVIRRLQLDGWLVVRFNGGGFKDATGRFVWNYIIAGLLGKSGRPATSGFPDVLALRGDFVGGRFLLLEIKDYKGKTSETQKHFCDFAQKFEIPVYIVRSPDELAGIYEKETP